MLYKLFATVMKYLRKTTKERDDLFWFMVFKVSVHGQLTPLSLGLCQGRNIVTEKHREEELLTSWKWKEQGPERRNTLQRQPLVTCFLHEALPPKSPLSKELIHQGINPFVRSVPSQSSLFSPASDSKPSRDFSDVNNLLRTCTLCTPW